LEQRKVVTNIKVTTSNNNNKKPRSNLGIKVKSTKPQAKEKERRETNTPRNVYPVRSNLSYSRGEIDPLSMSSYKEIQNGLQEISFNKLEKSKP